MNPAQRRSNALKAFQAVQAPKASGPSDFICQITSQSDEEIVLSLRGDVGDAWEQNDHATVVEALQGNPKAKVTMYINSMGGSVFEGFGIANAIVAHEGEVTAVIEGVAYSAATFPLLVADKVIGHKASTVGIHRSMVLTMGNQIEHAAAIQQLDVIDGILIDLYSAKTGLKPEAIIQMLDATIDGTMMSADKAVSLGFVDEIFDNSSQAEGGDLESDDDGEAEAKAELADKFKAHKALQRKRAGIAARVKLREITKRLEAN